MSPLFQQGDMSRHILSSLVVVFSMFGALSSASAIPRGNCDPETDSHQCECGEELAQYGSCDNIGYSDLVHPDNPEKLKVAAGISSSYDETTEKWIVEVDVNDFNGGAVLPMHGNRGEWETADQLFEYISTLTGIPRKDNGMLPSFDVHQNGYVARYNQFEERWATVDGANIIQAAISNDAGEVLVPKSSNSGCEEAKHDDKDGHRETEGKLQAGVGAYAAWEKLGIDVVGINGETHTFCTTVGEGSGTMGYLSYDGLTHKVSTYREPGSLEVRFRLVKVRADVVEIKNYHFWSPTSTSNYTHISHDSDSWVTAGYSVGGSFFKVLGSTLGLRADSVCTHQDVEKGKDKIENMEATAGMAHTQWDDMYCGQSF